jgi:hypothetical protein
MFASSSKEGRRIADWLGDAKAHKTHGRPISVATARSQGLLVQDLEADQQLQELVLSAFHAAMVTFQVTSCVKIVENQNGRGVYTQVQLRALPVAQ